MTTTVRTNYAYNPRGLSPNSYEYMTRWSWTRSFITGASDVPTSIAGDGVTSYVRMTSAGAQTGASRGCDWYENGDLGTPGTGAQQKAQPVTPGEVITLSGFMRGTVANTATRMEVRFHNGVGAWVGAIIVGSSVNMPVNTWVRASITVTVPAGATHVAARLNSSASATYATGDTQDFTGLLIERSSTANDYFDGSSPSSTSYSSNGATQTTYAWAGTANASSSVETVKSPVGGLPGWRAVLNGAVLSGGDEVGDGCLTSAPDGLGLPEIRTEDVTYIQRDGVKHFSDWYGPRILTFTEVWVCPDGCPGCPSARAKVKKIINAWSRACGDVELVLFTDCHGTSSDRSLVGPFGIIGRPRQALVTWVPETKCAILTLRFDAQDHRMYVLDIEGTAGSGTKCVTLNPDTTQKCRTYPRCYDMCYTTTVGSATNATGTAVNSGDVCAYPTITLVGPLNQPTIENQTSGESICYTANIPAGETITIDTYNGTATSSTGSSVTHLLGCSTRFQLEEGSSTLRLLSFTTTDTGHADVCWRDAVVTA